MSFDMPTRYPSSGGPTAGSVPVSVIVLTKDEEPNIERCLSSVAWADQVVVVDSGSTDRTVELARAAGADVIETHWRGFGAQREYALRFDRLRHDWVFFVDADEWVSTDLAAEVAKAINDDNHVAFWFYKRLIFQGRWIRHCGWYPSARIVSLLRRSRARFDDEVFSEHAIVTGPVGRLQHDIVDEDLKGLESWLHKHVNYARLEADRRRNPSEIHVRPHESRIRSLLKDRVARRLPCRPLVQFVYMYLVRQGFRDGREGLSFCFYHAWFQVTVVDILKVESDREAGFKTSVEPQC